MHVAWRDAFSDVVSICQELAAGNTTVAELLAELRCASGIWCSGQQICGHFCTWCGCCRGWQGVAAAPCEGVLQPHETARVKAIEGIKQSRRLRG